MIASATKPIQVVLPPGNKSTQPQETTQPPALPTVHLDEALAVLQAHKDAWVATGIDERIALLADIRRRMSAVCERWVAAILDAKGTTGDAFGTGEEWANNALMLEDAQKSVYRAPFHKLIDPYSVQSKRVAEFGRKLAAFDGSGSLARLVSLLWTAMCC